jgi:hypothetical protein
MQDKRPHNKQGEPHGHWIVYWIDGGHYECHYVNGLEYGLDDIDWGNGDKEKLSYAR